MKTQRTRMKCSVSPQPHAELRLRLGRRAPNAPIWESALHDAIAPEAEVILPMLAHNETEAADEDRRT